MSRKNFCIIVSFVTGSTAGVLSRNVQGTHAPICFSASKECNTARSRSVPNESLLRYLNDLERKIVGARYATEDLNSTVTIEDRWHILSDQFERETITKDVENGMMQYTNNEMPNFCNNTHVVFERLNELAHYIEFLLHKEQGLLNSNIETNMTKDFVHLQDEIYRCMCEMKLILRSLNCEPCTPVPSGQFSGYFQNRAMSTRADEMRAAYWVVLRSISDLTGIEHYIIVAKQQISV